MKRAPLALAVATLVALAAGVYLDSLRNGFALDDQAIIETNPAVHGVEHMGDAVTGSYWRSSAPDRGMWRPLVLATYAADWEIGGGSPVVFHLVNLLLHAAVTVLVLFLLMGLGAGLPAAWAGAAVFAVHPVHVEAVANIVGRAEILAALFFLAACLLYLRDPRRGWRTALGIGVAYFMALASKENAVVLPAILIGFHLYEERDVPAAARKAVSAWRVHAGLVAALAAYFALRYVNIGALLGTSTPAWFWGMPEEVRIFTAIRVWPEYLRLMLLPLDLVPDYGPGVIVPETGLLRPMVLLGLLTGAAVAFLAWKARSRLPLLSLGIGWFAITVLPVAGLLFPVGVILAERTLYLPSVAVAMGVAAAAGWAREREVWRPAVAGMVVVLALASVRTWTANAIWRDSLSVLNHLMDHHPASYRVQWGLGNHFLTRGDTVAALEHLALATRMVPGYVGLRGQYGELLYEIGQYERAEAQFDTALRVIPEAETVRQFQVLSLLQLDRPEQAARVAADGLRITADPTLRGLHARALARAGDFAAAADARRATIPDDPAGPPWAQWTHLAALELLAGDSIAAADALARARDTAPGGRAVPAMADLQRLILPANRPAIPLW